MSNDRIFLVCKCGEKRTLFKYYGYIVALTQETLVHISKDDQGKKTLVSEDYSVPLNSWVTEHLNECGTAGSVSIDSNPFTLMTEREYYGREQGGCVDDD